CLSDFRILGRPFVDPCLLAARRTCCASGARLVSIRRAHLWIQRQGRPTLCCEGEKRRFTTASVPRGQPFRVGNARLACSISYCIFGMPNLFSYLRRALPIHQRGV